MPYAPVNGIQLYYEVHGDGPGEVPAIIFAHGAGGNHISWWQQVPPLSQRYRCITFDHRGWGASVEASGGPGAGAFVEDLKQLLDHLEVEKAFLVSQSMGGRACLGFALAYPQRTLGLVLGDTTGGVSDPAVVAARGEAGSEPDINRRFFSAGFIQQHPNRAFLYNQIRLLNPERPATSPAPGGAPSGPTASDLGRLAPVPTLLIVGEEDPICPVPAMRVLQGLIPNSRLEIVPEAAHSAYFEQPAAFNKLVADFFEQVLSSTVGAPAGN
jgi:pimeloyl-ACP methyl ester carboxylesterase